ncbi:unnamed protein product [Zymoseptoria tritici ST99CH_3D1]|uniref:Uncharacterized protein n=1 Tax=Zymoseptoria tritici ST99CH_1E4 TaxID=1276532 RepID=A0A2H1GK29_ZYMTR|nr:unnamed protein product [Zymoseptoria tritici ST99CH_1E4]SMR56131.1 unnamed protein product [Zymoseptoria tritici ST99CH_3D1]
MAGGPSSKQRRPPAAKLSTAPPQNGPASQQNHQKSSDAADTGEGKRLKLESRGDRKTSRKRRRDENDESQDRGSKKGEDCAWILEGKEKAKKGKRKREEDSSNTEVSTADKSIGNKRTKSRKIEDASSTAPALEAEASANPIHDRSNDQNSTNSEDTGTTIFDFDALATACAQANCTPEDIDLGICDADWICDYTCQVVARRLASAPLTKVDVLIETLAREALQSFEALELLERSVSEVFNCVAWWFAFKFLELKRPGAGDEFESNRLATPGLSTGFARVNIGRPNGLGRLVLASGSPESLETPAPWQIRIVSTPGLSSGVSKLHITTETAVAGQATPGLSDDLEALHIVRRKNPPRQASRATPGLSRNFSHLQLASEDSVLQDSQYTRF